MLHLSRTLPIIYSSGKRKLVCTSSAKDMLWERACTYNDGSELFRSESSSSALSIASADGVSYGDNAFYVVLTEDQAIQSVE